MPYLLVNHQHLVTSVERLQHSPMRASIDLRTTLRATLSWYHPHSLAFGEAIRATAAWDLDEVSNMTNETGVLTLTGMVRTGKSPRKRCLELCCSFESGLFKMVGSCSMPSLRSVS